MIADVNVNGKVRYKIATLFMRRTTALFRQDIDDYRRKCKR